MKQTAAKTRKRVAKTQSKKQKKASSEDNFYFGKGATVSKDVKFIVTRPDTWNAFQDLPKRADGTEEGINTSQIQDFIRCGYRWNLRNRRMINRREIAPAMDLGSRRPCRAGRCHQAVCAGAGLRPETQ